MKQINYTLMTIGTIVLLFILVGASEHAKYKIVQKYYPNMTYVEYVLLEDKLRILPNDK